MSDVPGARANMQQKQEAARDARQADQRAHDDYTQLRDNRPEGMSDSEYQMRLSEAERRHYEAHSAMQQAQAQAQVAQIQYQVELRRKAMEDARGALGVSPSAGGGGGGGGGGATHGLTVSTNDKGMMAGFKKYVLHIGGLFKKVYAAAFALYVLPSLSLYKGQKLDICILGKTTRIVGNEGKIIAVGGALSVMIKDKIDEVKKDKYDRVFGAQIKWYRDKRTNAITSSEDKSAPAIEDKLKEAEYHNKRVIITAKGGVKFEGRTGLKVIGKTHRQHKKAHEKFKKRLAKIKNDYQTQAKSILIEKMKTFELDDKDGIKMKAGSGNIEMKSGGASVKLGASLKIDDGSASVSIGGIFEIASDALNIN